MPADIAQSDFRESYAVHAALRAANRSKLYAKDAAAQKAANRLLKFLESDGSIYGRHSRMVRLMGDGANIAQLCRALRCSRRTVFRYLLDLEKAGVEVSLVDGVYNVPTGLLRLVS
ncbi:MAG: helix-turn-helix domain-containing protein [Phycisphaerales bacterium]|nr:helix-turn-helix domain-containing protein [Phycisphaerales bacterium]